MKDFDEARRIREATERTFRAGGEEFHYKAAVAPEVILHWNQATSGEMPELGEEGWLDLYDETVLAILSTGQQEKWASVRDPLAEHPLNIGDLRAILQWLIVEATKHPTGGPSGSSTGTERTGPESKGGSSSPVAPSTGSPPVRSAA